jgi:hypothetical protein
VRVEMNEALVIFLLFLARENTRVKTLYFYSCPGPVHVHARRVAG